MASPLEIAPGTFNPSGIAPQAPAGMSQEEWDQLLQRMVNQLRTQEFYDSNPELGNIVPKAPGGKLPVSAPTGAPAPPLPASQVPAASQMGLPGQVASQGASQAATATGGFLPHIMQMLKDPSNLLNIAGVVTALAGASKGGGGTGSADAERMNQITEQRMQRVDPLHQAVTQLALGRLPISARQGITPPTYQPLK